MTDEEFTNAYAQIAHGIQSAIKFEYSKAYGDTPVINEIKHLRTGLNCLMSDLGSIGGLLIAKGLITREEYMAAILEGLEIEKERTSESVRSKCGLPDTVKFA